MDKPRVSVIMPVYNAENSLDESVLSVIRQVYPDWELWLIDDHSTDNSKSIIQNFISSDQRIKAIYFDANKGAAAARNEGIKSAAGKYIAFLDADDLWKPEKLEKQVEFMEGNNYNFTFTYYDIIGNPGKIIKSKREVNYKQLLKNNVIGCLTVMYDAEMLGKQYMPDLRKRQDYGLWLNILKTGNIAHCLPVNLASYRMAKNSLSGNKSSVLKYNWQLLRKNQNLPFIPSVYYFSCFLWNKALKYLK